ncbi:MAG: helix-turn-helix domain-containing protein [Filifactoraceae bacterium]
MKYVTVDEISKRLGVSKQTVREKLITKEIQGRKIGREWRILEKDLNLFLGVKNEEEYKSNIYIQQLEKENELLKMKIESLGAIVNSMNALIAN